MKRGSGVLRAYQEDIVEDLPHNVAVCLSIEHHAGILLKTNDLGLTLMG